MTPTSRITAANKDARWAGSILGRDNNGCEHHHDTRGKMSIGKSVKLAYWSGTHAKPHSSNRRSHQDSVVCFAFAVVSMCQIITPGGHAAKLQHLLE